jgi:hypothetical protein
VLSTVPSGLRYSAGTPFHQNQPNSTSTPTTATVPTVLAGHMTQGDRHHGSFFFTRQLYRCVRRGLLAPRHRHGRQTPSAPGTMMMGSVSGEPSRKLVAVAVRTRALITPANTGDRGRNFWWTT